jgi:hypothetical protein
MWHSKANPCCFPLYLNTVLWVFEFYSSVSTLDIKTSRKCGILFWDKANYEQFKEAEDLAWAIQKPLSYQEQSSVSWEIQFFWVEQLRQENKSSADESWMQRRSISPPSESGYSTETSPANQVDPSQDLYMSNIVEGIVQLHIGSLLGNVLTVPPSVLVTTWLEDVDVIFLMGMSPPSICDFMASKRYRKCEDYVCCVILPPSHITVNSNLQKIIPRHIALHFEVWARGPAEEKIFGSLPEFSKYRTVLVPWSTADWVVRESFSSSESILVALVVIESSSETVEDIRTACTALHQAISAWTPLFSRMRLTIEAMSPWGEWTEKQVKGSAQCMVAGSITIAEHSTPALLQRAMRGAGVVLFPSARGHSARRTLALQALHGGVPLIAVDAPPFSEVAVHEHDALLLPPNASSPKEVAAALQRLADPLAPAHLRTRFLRRLTCPQPGMLSARQHAFAMHVGHRLSRRPKEPPPSVVSFWPGPHPEHRRTELFRSDALRRHGFVVREAAYAEPLAPLVSAQAGAARFVVAAKPRTEFLERLAAAAAGTPVFVWTWDLIDFAHDPGRRPWFEAAARACRAAFLNEMGREGMWAAAGGSVHFVNDGTVLIGDRGAGRRPRRPPPAAGGAQAVFVGTVAAEEASEPHGRTQLLRAVMRAGEPPLPSRPRPWPRLGEGRRIWREEGSTGSAGRFRAASSAVPLLPHPQRYPQRCPQQVRR